MLSALVAAILTIASPTKPAMAMWRLECGEFLLHRTGSETPRLMSTGCYLIRHGDSYMLWDAGLPRSLIGKPEVSESQTISLSTSILDQLTTLEIRPEQVTRVGVSHYHGDHTGQAEDFPSATLLIGRADFEALAAQPADPNLEPQLLKTWISGKAPVVRVDRDYDVFGDGRVTILAMPGHTPGHTALLVRLDGGSFLLTGDLYHFADQIPESRVSGNATDPLAAKLSMARFQAIARETGATMIVQHDPAHITRLPAFPTAAR